MAFDLMLTLVVTSLLRARIGPRSWRAVHWLAYASWPVALAHGIEIGTDGRLVPILTAACVLAVGVAAARRLMILRGRDTGSAAEPPLSEVPLAAGVPAARRPEGALTSLGGRR